MSEIVWNPPSTTKDLLHKPFELIDTDGSGLKFYNSIKEATDDARDYWNLRWGWSIWKIEQSGRRKLWVKTYTDDERPQVKKENINET